MASINSKEYDDVIIASGAIVEEGANIGRGSYVDHGAIVRAGVELGEDSYVGVNCILGEYEQDFYDNMSNYLVKPLYIGRNSIIRSGTIIYENCRIGDNFKTGHNAVIRENTIIGSHCSVGTMTDIQGNCNIGNYVRLHSMVFVAPYSTIEDYVWVFPRAILTNDPTPPSNNHVGAILKSFSVVSAGALILPGVVVESDSLIAAGAIVSKNVEQYSVVAGVPAKHVSDIRNIRSHFDGGQVYPWRNYFNRGYPWEGIGYDTWSNNFENE